MLELAVMRPPVLLDLAIAHRRQAGVLDLLASFASQAQQAESRLAPFLPFPSPSVSLPNDK